MTRTKNKSPAKELRDLKRSISFIRRKTSNSKPNLSIYPQHYLSISPDNGPALTLTNLPSVSVAPKAPMKPKLEFSRTFYVEIALSPVVPIPVTTERVHAPLIHTDHDPISHYPQDEELREKNRQLDVQRTLQMIDQALMMLNNK